MIMNNLKILTLIALFSACTLRADTAKCDESDELTAEQGFAAAGDLVVVRHRPFPKPHRRCPSFP